MVEIPISRVFAQPGFNNIIAHHFVLSSTMLVLRTGGREAHQLYLQCVWLPCLPLKRKFSPLPPTGALTLIGSRSRRREESSEIKRKCP